MKQENFYLLSELIKENACARIAKIKPDGKTKVTISAAGSKSAKQRGAQWIWYTDVSKAGIGGKHEDTKEGVHLISKYRWAIPILVRDDAYFSDIYSAWVEKWGDDESRMLWFVDQMVRTEKFNVSQMSEFLEGFQRHYSQYVNLTEII